MIEKFSKPTFKYAIFPLLILFLVTGYPAQADKIEHNELDYLSDSEIEPNNHQIPLIDQNQLWVIPDDWHFSKQESSDNVMDKSKKDDFGYSWDDTIPVDWVDATLAENTGMSGSSSGQYVGPVDLGFSFPYYENIYAEVYIAASGFLTFSYSNDWPNQSQIPASSEPNGVIAPYWAPLYLSEEGPSGQVYYLQGGQDSERYFVVEWAGVAGGSPDDEIGVDDSYHFQVILYENGDIRFQYHQMNYSGDSYCGTAGIEDSLGEDGINYLPFCAPAPSNRAVLFSRPAPAARVRVSPPYHSRFVIRGEAVSFPFMISNIGELGDDTFELSTTSSWALSFFDLDGVTPLIDTNDDGNIDTAELKMGETRQIIVKVAAPIDALIGDSDQPTITLASSIDPSISRTVTMQVAVPGRFAQVFRDDEDGAMGLFLAQPDNISIQQTTNDAWWGYNPAIAETDSGGFIYLWQRWRYSENSQNFNTELEFILIDYAGNSLTPATKLTDHNSATLVTFDEEPVVAVAPNGAIGIAWRRRILRQSSGGMQENWNVYFAILSREGQVVFGPTNLTQNNGWYQTNPITYDVPRYWDVHLAVNEKNNFALAWRREAQEKPSQTCGSQCTLDDIYIAVSTSLGAPLVSPTRVTKDTLGMSEGYYSPNVTALSGGRWLTIYNHNPGGLAISVLDSQGNLILSRSFIGKFGWSPVAKQLINSDSIVIAWTAWTGNNPQIHMLVLDGNTYEWVSGPDILTNPAALTGGDYASLAADSNGRAILTWMDFNANNRHQLYYVLIDETGSILTTPMVFHTAKTDTNGLLHIETGVSGNSIATYRKFLDVPLTYWASGWIEQLNDVGITRGCSADPPSYCPEETTTRAQMAVLLGRAIYGRNFIPPAVDEPVFADVPPSHWAAPWIEQLYHDGLTRGCDQEPLRYCPENNITRDEMAVFLVRVMYGYDYNPPAPTGVFADVPTSHWAAPWIEQLYRDGITTGCSSAPLLYCPGSSTTRAEIAVFLGRTFDLSK